MGNKKMGVIAIAMVAIFLGVVFGFKMNTTDNNESQNESNITQNKIENEITNTSIENNITTKNSDEGNNIEENTINENTIDENKPEENKTTENTVSDNKTTNATTKENKTNNTTSNTTKEKDQEKIAISLVKEKWGNTNSDVYFDVEEKNESKGIYIIVVRDNNTTIEMVTYKVDVNKKTVTEQ